MYDIVCMGESVVDFTPLKKDRSLQHCEGFYTNPGGSSFNTAVQASRLGSSTALLSKLGVDAFSCFLRSFLEKEHVDTQWICVDEKFIPAMAFISYKNNIPDFHIVKDHSCTHNISISEFPFKIIEKTRFFQFGSYFSYQPASYDLVLSILKRTKKNNVFTCFDPNIRKHTIEDDTHIQSIIESYAAQVNCIKLSRDDIQNLYGSADHNEICKMYIKKGCDMVILTKDIDGGCLYTAEYTAEFRSFPQNSGDSVGAGDTFNAAFLSKLATFTDPYKKQDLIDALEFGAAAAAVCCSGYGALSQQLSHNAAQKIRCNK